MQQAAGQSFGSKSEAEIGGPRQAGNNASAASRVVS